MGLHDEAIKAFEMALRAAHISVSGRRVGYAAEMTRWGLVVCIVAACGDDGGNNPADASMPDAPIGAATIGPEGGAVASSDGVAILTVPAGALSDATELTIDIVPQSAWPANLVGAEPVGAVYVLGPEGTTFALPATLTWTFATAPANARDGGKPRLLYGYSRSAAGLLEPHTETVSTPGAAGGLMVVSTLAHLSHHVLTAKRPFGDAWTAPVGTLTIDQRPGRHAVDVAWDAAALELMPFASAPDVKVTIRQQVPAPIADLSQSPWDQSGHLYGSVTVSLTDNQPWRPEPLPRYKCTAQGMTMIEQRFSVSVAVANNGGIISYAIGSVNDSQEIECYARVEKTEYTQELSGLGQARVSPLSVPATGTQNLADHAGAFGYRVDIPPGATVRICVSASMSASVNYYPQYPPGFTFLDGQAGCTDITNLDPDNPNTVLVRVAGGGSPNNITVTTSVP